MWLPVVDYYKKFSTKQFLIIDFCYFLLKFEGLQSQRFCSTKEINFDQINVRQNFYFEQVKKSKYFEQSKQSP